MGEENSRKKRKERESKNVKNGLHKLKKASDFNNNENDDRFFFSFKLLETGSAYMPVGRPQTLLASTVAFYIYFLLFCAEKAKRI